MSPKENVLAAMESYLLKYMGMPAEYAFVASLWAIGTRLWDQMDAFGYVVITAETKRAGKTRLMELLSFLSRNAQNLTGVTASTVFRLIRDKQPTLFIDEAENLTGAANDLRSALNAGYRRGTSVPRTEAGTQEIVQWPVYCPKVFVLIGDTFDTLNDRSIVFRLRRAKQDIRFSHFVAQNEGAELGRMADSFIKDAGADVLDTYASQKLYDELSFMGDRDVEVWTPLFAIAKTLAPQRMEELKRIAVDMATLKTQEATRHTALEIKEAEREATDVEYATRLLRDMLTAMGKGKFLYTRDALEKLKDITDAPWRKFRGTGLDDRDMANLLARFEHVRPRLIRTPRVKGGDPKAKENNTVARGYARADVEAALKRIGE